MDALLIETIEVLKGVPSRLNLHNARMQQSGADLGFVPPTLSMVEAAICTSLSDCNLCDTEQVRCTLTYRTNIVAVRSVSYARRDITALVPIELPEGFSYRYKWCDRSYFGEISKGLPAGHEAIFVRDGLVTDTTFTNIAIENDRGLFTPRAPLLYGTRRQYYIDCGMLREADLTLEDLRSARCLHLINAMLPLHSLTIGDLP